MNINSVDRVSAYGIKVTNIIIIITEGKLIEKDFGTTERNNDEEIRLNI